jgi:hypothetical protein
MAETKKVLGQSAPSATILTDVYTVPASRSAVVSTITVCNRGASSTTFRVSVAPSGAADANSQYLYYDVTIPANETFSATIGITLATTDVVRIYAGNANLSMSIFGVEIS